MKYTRRKRRITKKKRRSKITIKKHKGGSKKHYKCIILIIDHTHVLTDSSTAEYKRNNTFKDITKKYINSDPDIYGLFICGDDTLTSGNYRLDDDNNTLYTPSKETYTPGIERGEEKKLLSRGIIDKTLLAMKYVLDHYSFDYLLRTNLSTFIVLPKFKKSLETVDKNNLFKGPIWPKSQPMFISGTHFLFSIDVIQKLVENNINSLLKECSDPEDICISQVCAKLNIPFTNSSPRYDFIDIDKDETSIENRIKQSDSDHNIYMYRIKSGEIILNMDTAANDIMILNKLYNYFYNNKIGGYSNANLKDITIAILSWKSCKTLKNTLESYKNNNLLNILNSLIYFQEIGDNEKTLASKYNIPYIGSEENMDIYIGLKELVNNCKTKYFIFAESDFELIHKEDTVIKVLNDCILLLENNDVQYIRLRDVADPGEPLYSQPLFEKIKNDTNAKQKFKYKLDTISHTNLEETFPNVFNIINYNYKWYITSCENSIFTNNIFMAKTEWLKNIVLPFVENHMTSERNKVEDIIDNKLKGYNLAAGMGLFKHNRLDRGGCETTDI